MSNKLILIVVLVLVAAGIIYLEGKRPSVQPVESLSTGEQNMRIAAKSEQYEQAKEITTPDGFLNTPSTSSGQASSITLKDLIGKKVILLDFWTYSCINCQRTTPYLNAWYEKYQVDGLEIVGIHTPEFDFEKKYENVKRAVEEAGIKFPVVLDNDFSTWHAYRNRFWPRKYLIDIDGFIVYDHAGEGAYQETEGKIQAALRERAEVLALAEEIEGGTVNPGAVESSGNTSPELYFGSARNQKVEFTLSGEPVLDTLYLTGGWTVTPEYAEAQTVSDKITYRYRAKNVYMVAESDAPVMLTVKQDGQIIKTLTTKDSKLYTLVENATPGEHTLELTADKPGLRVYTFTFG